MLIRRNRMTIANVDTTIADEYTQEGQVDIARFYLEHQPPRNMKRLNEPMCLLLLRLSQGWSDEEFRAALGSGEILYCVHFNKRTLIKRKTATTERIYQPCLGNRRRGKRKIRVSE